MRTLVTAIASLTTLILANPIPASQVTSLGALRLVERDEVKTVPYTVEYQLSRDLGAGRLRKVQDGMDGKEVVRTSKVLVEGRVLHRRTRTVSRLAMRPAVFRMGRAGFRTSRGSFTRSRLARMEATAYVPNPRNPGRPPARTASGKVAGYGVVAVDPRVISLGTVLFVEGYGFAVAADTGGAIKGNIIDVCLPTMREVRTWGRRQVTVHIFRERIPLAELRHSGRG